MKKIIYIITLFIFPQFASGENQTDSLSTNKNHRLGEVVITGTRNETDVRHLPMTVSVVNRDRIEKSYEQSLLPVLTEQIPNFFTTSRGILGYGVSGGAAGGMTLRGIGGSPTAGLLVLIDGHPQYMGLMGHPIADAYQTMLAEKVEVLRGPASVLYGSNAMGGVINIVTRKQSEDAIKNHLRVGYGSYNTLTTEASNSIRKGKFTSFVTASYNRTDGHRKDLNFEQYGGYAKVGYDFSNSWHLFTDVNVTHFNASNPGAISAPILDNDSRITRGMTSVSLENTYAQTSGALKFFYNWGRHKINDGYKEVEQPLEHRFNSKDQMLGISWYQSASLFEGNRLTVGLDYQRFGGEAWNRFVTDGHEVELSDKTEDEIAAYADLRQTFGRFTFDAGVRFDHHSITGTEWIPQVGLSTELSRSASLKAMVSKGFRNPTIRELYMFNPANPNLLPERLWNYELSFSQSALNNALFYEVNLFYIKGDNMIQTIRVEGRPLNMNTGEIENWGVELQTAYRINRNWRVSANYSWLRMVHPVVAAPEHKLYAGADFSKGRWDISTGMQYINGLYTGSNLAQKESFVLWNVRGSYQLHKAVRLFAKGENLLAQRYEINAGYPMPKATVTGGINLTF